VKVLLVDDSAAIRARLVAMLREVPGVEIREAAHADEALEAVRAEPPDLVVLDVHMPGKSGLEVLAPIKAAPSRPLVVVLTSHPTEPHGRLSLARGADLYLDKSRDFGRLVELVAVRRW
jgi:DNA-binding NarL/FixJ family response regulator